MPAGTPSGQTLLGLVLRVLRTAHLSSVKLQCPRSTPCWPYSGRCLGTALPCPMTDLGHQHLLLVLNLLLLPGRHVLEFREGELNTCISSLQGTDATR